MSYVFEVEECSSCYLIDMLSKVGLLSKMTLRLHMCGDGEREEFLIV